MRLVLLLVFLGASASIYGQEAIGVDPHHIHNYYINQVFVFYADVNRNPTSTICREPNRWAFKLGSVGSQELISMIVAAKLAGQKISVSGNGTCDVSGEGYRIVAVWIDD